MLCLIMIRKVRFTNSFLVLTRIGRASLHHCWTTSVTKVLGTQLLFADDALWSTTHVYRVLVGANARAVRSATASRPAMKLLPVLRASFAPMRECTIGVIGVWRVVVRNNSLHVVVRQLCRVVTVLLR